jgi:L-fuculose-phosphate aldolase
MTRLVRKDVVATSRFLHERGWVANHDGNVTARDGNTIVATPTATSKRLVDDAGLIEVDAGGKVTAGRGKAFGELGLHLAVYARRADVGAVVHAHPPHATAIACASSNPIERPFIVEALVSLGPAIPKVPFAAPGDAAVQALAPWCELVDAVLLTGHGVIAWGKDCEQALLRLELVEHLARIALAAAPLGGVQSLPDSILAPMMAARAKAGIGRAADRAVETLAKLSGPRPVVACAPAPHSPVPTIAPGGARSDSKADLAALIREEIVRALK